MPSVERVIVALDVGGLEPALALCDQLQGEVEVKWRRAPEMEKVKVADAARICAERVRAELVK